MEPKGTLLVLGQTQRAIRAPKGTVPFGKGLAKTPIVLRANCESWQSFIVKTRAPGLRYASQSSDRWPMYQLKPGALNWFDSHGC